MEMTDDYDNWHDPSDDDFSNKRDKPDDGKPKDSEHRNKDQGDRPERRGGHRDK
jgi:hypothetical protein